jgi:formiminoglutamase
MPDDLSWLLESTTRPESSLFFTRNSSADPRMGDSAGRAADAYASADVVLLGCPQDEGVRRNGGRPGAAAAPDAIRDRLYRLVSVPGVRLFDLGDTLIDASLEETHDRQRRIMAQLIHDGKTVIALGGGNDLSYPDCAGLATAAGGEVLAFNLDTHFDVREDTPRNSGTPYRQLIEERILGRGQLCELGHQPFAVAQAHRDYLERHGAQVHALTTWRAGGIVATVEGILAESRSTAVFWGLDMDVVRASDAPGVSAPSPTGLSAEEVCALAEAIGGEPRSRVLEITEVNPSFDIDMRTSRLAALVIWHFLSARAAPQ